MPPMEFIDIEIPGALCERTIKSNPETAKPACAFRDMRGSSKIWDFWKDTFLTDRKLEENHQKGSDK